MILKRNPEIVLVSYIRTSIFRNPYRSVCIYIYLYRYTSLSGTPDKRVLITFSTPFLTASLTGLQCEGTREVPQALAIQRWEFPKIWGALFWGPYNKDPTILGSILGSLIFGTSQI